MNNIQIAIYELEKLSEEFALWGYDLTHDRLDSIIQNLKLIDKRSISHNPDDN